MSFLAMGMSLIGDIKGHQAAVGQAESQSELSQLQIDEANAALEKLEPAKAAKTQVAQEEFKFSSEAFGLKVEDANKQLGTAIQKSGLVQSAGITAKKSSMWKQFEQSERGLMGQLGKKMGGIEEWFEGETSRLEMIKKKAELQKKSSDKAADAPSPAKGYSGAIGGLFGW